jgi:hypothetical protein
VKVDENHHLWSKSRIARAAGRPSRWSRVAELIKPIPSPRVTSKLRGRRRCADRRRSPHESFALPIALALEQHREFAMIFEMLNIGLMQGFAGLSLFACCC